VLPTRRLFIILLLAAPLGAVGGVWGTAALALAILGLLAGAVDWLLAADGRRVAVVRDVANKLSLGVWNPVALEVDNPLDRPLRVDVREVVPPDFAIDATSVLFPTTVPPRGRATLDYRARPRHRGRYQFGDVSIRVTGPLGLARRQLSRPNTGQQVRVYPNLRDLRKYDLVVRRGLQLEAGARPVRMAGGGTEFERLREYVPDDDFRRINWKATARRGEPMVNQLEAERSQNVVVMLDAGRLMAARVDVPTTDTGAAVLESEWDAGLTKLDHALNAALLLAYVASLRGDRVALLAYTDGVRAFVPPAHGRQAFLTMVQAFYDLRSEPIEPDHGLAFDFLDRRNLRRSLVVLFTDLVDRESSAGLVSHLLRASRHHLVVCVTLRDPTVARPAAARPHDAVSLYEKMVAQRLLDERAEVIATLGRHGVLSLDTDADKLSPRLVATYLDLKARGRI